MGLAALNVEDIQKKNVEKIFKDLYKLMLMPKYIRVYIFLCVCSGKGR